MFHFFLLHPVYIFNICAVCFMYTLYNHRIFTVLSIKKLLTCLITVGLEALVVWSEEVVSALGSPLAAIIDIHRQLPTKMADICHDWLTKTWIAALLWLVLYETFPQSFALQLKIDAFVRHICWPIAMVSTASIPEEYLHTSVVSVVIMSDAVVCVVWRRLQCDKHSKMLVVTDSDCSQHTASCRHTRPRGSHILGRVAAGSHILFLVSLNLAVLHLKLFCISLIFLRMHIIVYGGVIYCTFVLLCLWTEHCTPLTIMCRQNQWDRTSETTRIQ